MAYCDLKDNHSLMKRKHKLETEGIQMMYGFPT